MTTPCEHHYWRLNPLLDGPEFRCHDCPAVGDDCPECEGFGEIDDEFDTLIEIDCPACGGRGIVIRTEVALDPIS